MMYDELYHDASPEVDPPMIKGGISSGIHIKTSTPQYLRSLSDRLASAVARRVRYRANVTCTLEGSVCGTP